MTINKLLLARHNLWPWALMGLLAFSLAWAPLPIPQPAPTARTFRLEARSFEYSPAVIQVNRGDQVTLELVSTDVVHGLYIDGYDLQVIADPGQTARLTFTANRSGSFRFRCAVACGALHPFMIGQLKVGPNTLFWRAAALSLLAIFAALLYYRQSRSSADPSISPYQ